MWPQDRVKELWLNWPAAFKYQPLLIAVQLLYCQTMFSVLRKKNNLVYFFFHVCILQSNQFDLWLNFASPKVEQRQTGRLPAHWLRRGPQAWWVAVGEGGVAQQWEQGRAAQRAESFQLCPPAPNKILLHVLGIREGGVEENQKIVS